MYATPINHVPRNPARDSFASRALPLGATAGTGATAAAAARSQRLLVQWSLLRCPDRGKGRAR